MYSEFAHDAFQGLLVFFDENTELFVVIGESLIFRHVLVAKFLELFLVYFYMRSD